MIDSEPHKVRHYPYNSIVFPAYTEDELRNDSDLEQVKILKKVRAFIFKMLEEEDDVQSFLKSHKLSEF